MNFNPKSPSLNNENISLFSFQEQRNVPTMQKGSMPILQKSVHYIDPFSIVGTIIKCFSAVPYFHNLEYIAHLCATMYENLHKTY